MFNDSLPNILISGFFLILLLLIGMRYGFRRSDPKELEQIIKYLTLAMVLFLLGSLIYALLIGDWIIFLGCLPFAIGLLPSYRKLMSWGYRQKYSSVYSLIFFMPLPVASMFIGMYIKSGFHSAIIEAAKLMALCMALGIVQWLSYKMLAIRT